MLEYYTKITRANRYKYQNLEDRIKPFIIKNPCTVMRFYYEFDRWLRLYESSIGYEGFTSNTKQTYKAQCNKWGRLFHEAKQQFNSEDTTLIKTPQDLVNWRNTYGTRLRDIEGYKAYQEVMNRQWVMKSLENGWTVDLLDFSKELHRISIIQDQ